MLKVLDSVCDNLQTLNFRICGLVTLVVVTFFKNKDDNKTCLNDVLFYHITFIATLMVVISLLALIVSKAIILGQVAIVLYLIDFVEYYNELSSEVFTRFMKEQEASARSDIITMLSKEPEIEEYEVLGDK